MTTEAPPVSQWVDQSESGVATRGSRPPLPLGVHIAAVTLSVVVMAVVTSDTYFFADDFYLLRLAQEKPYSLAYLRQPIYEHFSPVLHTWAAILARWFDGNFTVARLMALLLFAGCVFALNRLLAELFGSTWLSVGLTLVYGLSLFSGRILEWWTTSAHILSCTLLSILTIFFFVRFLRLHNRRWLVASVVTYAACTLTHERSYLVPGYLVLIVVLFFGTDATLRSGLRRVIRLWWVWLVYGLVWSAALTNYMLGGYRGTSKNVGVGRTAAFIVRTFFKTFLTSLFGFRVPGAVNTTGHGFVLATPTITFVVCATAMAALVIYAVMRSRRAWRSVVFFAIVFSANLALVGVPRIRMFGFGIGNELSYYQEVSYLFPIALGFALSASRTSIRRVAGPGIGPAGSVRPRPRRPIPAVVMSSYLIVQAGLLIVGYIALRHDNVDPRAPKAFFAEFDRSLTRVERSRQPFSLIDGTALAPVMAGWQFPYNRYDSMLRIFHRDLAFEEYPGRTYRVDGDGGLTRVRFGAVRDLSTNDVARVAEASGGARRRSNDAGAGACFKAVSGVPHIEIPIDAAGLGPDAYVLVVLHTDGSSFPGLSAVTGAARAALPVLARAPATQGVYAAIGADSIGRLSIDVPKRGTTVCVSRVAIGHFEPA